MTVEQIEREAFRQIRRKANDITDDSSNDEIAGFAKGIVALETEIYKMLEEENRKRDEKASDLVRSYNLGA
nr:MAG TPA: hypothetical protein [Caudoviricetes sp.]